MSPISSALWTRTRKSVERSTLIHEGTNTIPLALRIAALGLRALFIGILVVLVARVSSPQNETIWSAYDTPGDLIRVVLGLVACLWMLYSVFTLPKGRRGVSGLDLHQPSRRAARIGVRNCLLVTISKTP